MQKKIIALAIAGLASTAAFAQSNVTIYGIIDYGMTTRFDGANGLGTTTALNGGQAAGNRLGFKGTEDLGNGVKAVFLFEQGFNGDTTSGDAGANAGNIMFNRQSYVGLTGGFGTLIGGRLYTPHYTFVSGLDPFAAGTVGRYNNTYGAAAYGAAILGGVADPVRVDNALAYVSPNFGGFTATLAYSNNALANDTVNSSGVNNRVYAVLGQYASGMFTAGVNYHYIETSGFATGTADSVQNVVAGGSVNLGVAKIAGFASYSTLDSAAKSRDLYNYMLGVTVPVGKVSIKASANYSDYDRLTNTWQAAVGADYALSKRTNLYTAYAYIDNDHNRAAALGDATNAASTGPIVADSMGVASVQTQGFQVGVKHMF
jgi:predicted porin